MSKKTRTKLFFLFLTIFLIITPIITLYATGYKIKLTRTLNFKNAIQKTGMLVLETEPNKAKIYINNKPQKSFLKKYFTNKINILKTPAKIKNLMPGEYDIRLELEGYHTWQKKLIITPGQSTFAKNIYLFKKNIPQQIVNFPINISSQSPDRKKIIVLNKEQAKIINSNEEIINYSYNNLKPTDSKIIWSADSKKIIITYPHSSTNLLIDSENNKKIINLAEHINKNIYNIKWDENNSKKIYYQENNLIKSYTIDSKEEKQILTEKNCLDYLIKNDFIFYISKINNKIKLKIYSIKRKNTIGIIDIPCSQKFSIINKEHKYLNLYDNQHEILYLIDPLSTINPLKEIITNIKYSKWVNKNTLLYSNDFEIWNYDILNNKKELITRISNQINNIIWHPNNAYIIYSTQNSIYTIELDKREKRNINQLLKFNSISSLYLNIQENLFYFIGKAGNQEGLYKFSIN